MVTDRKAHNGLMACHPSPNFDVYQHLDTPVRGCTNFTLWYDKIIK